MLELQSKILCLMLLVYCLCFEAFALVFVKVSKYQMRDRVSDMEKRERWRHIENNGGRKERERESEIKFTSTKKMAENYVPNERDSCCFCSSLFKVKREKTHHFLDEH